MNKRRPAPRARLLSDWVTVDGLRLHTRLATGAAQPGRIPVVCVHGLAVSSRYMVPTAERLAPFYPVYAPDLPGFGKSEKPPQALGVAELTLALEQWMDRYGLQRAAMVGNSMGCQIIAELAAKRPDRVSRAVLIGPTVDMEARSMLRQALRLAHDTLHEPPSSLITQGYDYARFGVWRTLVTFRKALRNQIEANAPHMRQPTLVIRGENDPIAPQRWAEQLTRLLPNGRLMVLRNAPHAANYSAPDAVALAVRAFLL
ncbi:MAG: alpha/beta hydrolase [Chloroflexales bacterium]|nr:alpha/beta hydrolase [Chloroflexales bacterium]